MLFALVDLGLSAPFVGILLVGLTLASIVACVVTLALSPPREVQPPTRAHKSLVGSLVWIAVFLLWGTSSGHGGPIPGGGITGFTHGGLLQYVTVTSHQGGGGAEWSHGLSFHVRPLIGTVALSVAVLIVGALALRRRPRIAEPGAALDTGRR